jgi:Domain of unknown function (DUF1835)
LNMTTNIVHIGNDAITCGVIQQSGVDWEKVIYAPEALSAGPILRFDSPLFLNSRRLFWKKFLGEIFDTSQVPDAYETLLEKIPLLRNADKIIIWSGPDLEEQLFLVWVVSALQYLGLDASKIHYLFVDQDPIHHRPIFKLSALSVEGAALARSHAMQLREDELKVMTSAWKAWSSNDPNSLNVFARRPTDTLPILINRMGMLKQRYPEIKSGLPHLDLEILQACEGQGSSAIKIYLEYFVGKEASYDRVGDSYLLARMLKLGSNELPTPLLKLTGDPKEFRTINAELTDAGKAVLAGKANQLELNGIDEWIGGVYLQSPPAPVWYYDQDSDMLVKP